MTSSNDNASRNGGKEEDPSPSKQAYMFLAGAAAGSVGIATVFYHVVEEWSWVDSLYFSTVAITTVGFGDLTPTSDGSKIFTIVYLITGISIVAAYLDARLKVHGTRVTRHRRGSSDGDDPTATEEG